MDEEMFTKLKKAFTETEYIGNADVKFRGYLRRCYEAYDSRTCTAPCVAVTQSSGFGKSRMIWELALKARDDKEMNMKVLYMCVRKHFSTGYPRATGKLYDWLFLSRDARIGKQLKRIYYYAIKHWDTVQSEWQELFIDTRADRRVVKALHNAVKVKEKPAKIPGGKMVVVVIDDARNLIENGYNGINAFHKALVSANIGIGNEGGIFGVLVDTNPLISNPSLLTPNSCRSLSSDADLVSLPPFVLAHTMDANWKKYCRDVMRRSSSDSEEEKKGDAETIVNGEEAEVSMEDQIAVYKRLVTRRKRRKAFDALMRMGRPTWHSTYSHWKGINAITIAACKLMVGLDTTRDNFTEETMFGVASVLCRIGVRPRSMSSSVALAPRTVANFMATLAYISFDRECYVCNYASDPILTAGAMRVWHVLDNGLADYILPRLEQLIGDELLDTGGPGQVVATVLMLLAMDACVTGINCFGRYELPDYYQIVKFVRVKKFLEMLNVAEMQISYEGTFNEEKRPVFDEWMSKWKKWRMGFSHFVQLVLEPNEDTLWYLLGRRAAGIFPREDGGADLLIPMFTKDTSGESRVSLMLIFVKTQSKEMVIEELPRHKFGQNPLSGIPIHDIIHIYFNVGNDVMDSFRFICAEPLADFLCESTESNGEVSLDGSEEVELEQEEDINCSNAEIDGVVFTLCFGSVCRGTFSFLSKEVAERLKSIARYTGDFMMFVDCNLKRYQDEQKRMNKASRTSLSEEMPCETVRKTVSSFLAYEPGIEKNGKHLKRGRDDQGDALTGPVPKRSMMALEIYKLHQSPLGDQW